MRLVEPSVLRRFVSRRRGAGSIRRGPSYSSREQVERFSRNHPESCRGSAIGLSSREHFLENLALDWPEELERYERLYRRRAYLGKEQTKPLREQVNALAKEHGVRDRRNVRLEPEPPVIAEQLALAV